MIRSAIAGNQELAGYDTRQAVFAAIGLAVLMGAAIMDYHYWQSLTRIMYFGTVFFLVLVFVIGLASFGAARWLDTGLVVVQPAELAKIVMILVLANYFDKTQKQPHDLRWIANSFLLTAGVVIWVFLQPNLSTSIVLFVIWFALLWMSGLPTKYLILFLIIGLILPLIAFPFLEEYQQLRIINFIFPDPNARHGNTFNVDQAKITIGSGGFFGQGYGHSTQVQLRFLKVRHTDFIFSAMAAEFGFVGVLFILGLLVFVIFRCLRAARLANDLFGALIAYGFATLIFFQAAVNISVNLNIIPVTGLTLPFISYGGSSLVSLVFGIGLVESVVARRRRIDI